MRYPVRWACLQNVNDDGSPTFRPTNRLNVSDVTGGRPAVTAIVIGIEEETLFP
jgi:hypothetical protein